MVLQARCTCVCAVLSFDTYDTDSYNGFSTGITTAAAAAATSLSGATDAALGFRAFSAASSTCYFEYLYAPISAAIGSTTSTG